MWLFFFKNVSIIEQKKSNFFFVSVEIHMEEVDSTESKEKSNFWFFRFIFFELWLFLLIFVPQFCFVPHNSKNWHFIRFSTLRIICKNRIKIEGRGARGVCEATRIFVHIFYFRSSRNMNWISCVLHNYKDNRIQVDFSFSLPKWNVIRNFYKNNIGYIGSNYD